jgi:hypothetical protein
MMKNVEERYLGSSVWLLQSSYAFSNSLNITACDLDIYVFTTMETLLVTQIDPQAIKKKVMSLVLHKRILKIYCTSMIFHCENVDTRTTHCASYSSTKSVHSTLQKYLW